MLYDTEAVPEHVPGAAEMSRSHFSLPSASASGALPLLPSFCSAENKEIVQARVEGVPVKTEHDKKHCVGLCW